MTAFLNTQGDAIAAVLRTVADIGVVLSTQPNPAPMQQAAFIDMFTTEVGGTRTLRAWTVQYLGEQRYRSAIAIGATKTVREIDWIVRAHLAWGVDTESTFRFLVDDVAKALDAAVSLGGTALDHVPVRVAMPAQGAGIVLGDTLCHYAELTFTAKVEQTLTTS